MKNSRPRSRRWLWLLAALLSCRTGGEMVLAQGTGSKAGTNVATVKFRPPAKGAPSVRVTGGSRGSGDAAVTLDVLAPDDVGVTTHEQPSLFWFQSKPSPAKFELTLLQEKKVEPLVQVTVARSAKAGIQRLKLADHGAKLTPGVEYQWVVALVNDPENRSSDLVASGVIKRVEPAPELKRRIAQASPETLPRVYAEAGVWYDALSALSDLIAAHPRDSAWREARADLLRQVDLKTAAASESSLPKDAPPPQ